jgi:RecA/RadA recombinase
VHVAHCAQFDAQEALLRYHVPAFLEQARYIKLVILDSAASNLRVEEASRSERSQKVFALGAMLKELNMRFGATVVCTNQVTGNFGEEAGEFRPALGRAWTCCVTERVTLRRLDRERADPFLLSQLPVNHPTTTDHYGNNVAPRTATVSLSSRLPQRSCYFHISNDGVSVAPLKLM